jgi:hypothetical protein
MRTEEFRDFHRKLSTINKNFSHGLFLSEQFLIDNAQLIANSGDAFSRDVYTSNSYREKFNYRLKSLPDEIKEYQKASFISFYVFMYSAFELYIEELAAFVKNILTTGLHKSNKENFLEAIFRSLGTNINQNLNTSEIDTMDYIRLRRNRLIHADGQPSQTLITLMNTKGQQLNEYWKSTRVQLNIIDFSAIDIGQFEEREIIDGILILRELAKKIDQAVLSRFRKEDILAYILDDFQKVFVEAIKRKPKRRLENMFASIAKRRFNIDRNDINFAVLIF